jgi:hypothetical protein
MYKKTYCWLKSSIYSDNALKFKVPDLPTSFIFVQKYKNVNTKYTKIWQKPELAPEKFIYIDIFSFGGYGSSHYKIPCMYDGKDNFMKGAFFYGPQKDVSSRWGRDFYGGYDSAPADFPRAIRIVSNPAAVYNGS